MYGELRKSSKWRTREENSGKLSWKVILKSTSDENIEQYLQKQYLKKELGKEDGHENSVSTKQNEQMAHT